MNSGPAPRRIGVFPAAERAERRRLFDALEQAYPVSFEARQPGELRGLDAAIEFSGSGEARAAADAGTLALSMVAPEPGEPGGRGELVLSTALALDQRLRGAVLDDAHLGDPALTASLRGDLTLREGGETVLASFSGIPFWTREGSFDQALLAPAELEQSEPLRQRLQAGRCAALLPLVHLLGELTEGLRWRPPPARAAFLLDDPNLHWPSYGFIKLRELLDHARAHGYHLALATIPLDGWYAHPKAVSAIAGSGGALSLCVHGNDHSGGELGRMETEQEAIELTAQALHRVRSFERRTGVRVDRVMAPPHEACSEESVRALLRCGFEAISMTRPFPWAAPSHRPWLAQPRGADPLVGWRPADFIAGGLPLLLRHPLIQRKPTELRIRAYLDQPLVLYGHHGDLEAGPGVLAEAAAEINALGGTTWCSLGEIAASGFETLREGELTRVRLLTRRARVEIPPESSAIAIRLPASHSEPECEEVIVDGRPVQRHGDESEPVEVRPGATVEVEMRHSARVDVSGIQARRPRPLAVARRVAGEGRDRVLPLLARSR